MASEICILTIDYIGGHWFYTNNSFNYIYLGINKCLLNVCQCCSLMYVVVKA